jgi:pyrroline-5-carboxylate reductase
LTATTAKDDDPETSRMAGDIKDPPPKSYFPIRDGLTGELVEVGKTRWGQGLKLLAEILTPGVDKLVELAAQPPASSVEPKKKADPDRVRLPLLRRIQPSNVYARFGLDDVHFTEKERKILTAWAKKSFALSANASLRPSLLLMALVRSKVDLSTPAGVSARDTLFELGLLAPFARRMLDSIHESWSKHDLSKVHFHYNGHASEAMFPLFPMLSAAGVRSGSMNPSSYSGTGAMQSVLNFQLTGRMSHHGGTYSDEYVLKTLESEARQAAANGKILIVDKGGPLAKTQDPYIKDLIRTGGIRFLVHNRDDQAALEKIAGEAFMIDLAGSDMKAIEAQVIGEEYALFGARQMRESFGERIGDHSVYVVGFGLLGEAVAEAHARLGMPREKIVIVENDPEKRKKAAEAGFEVLDEAKVEASERPERAVVYVATPGAGIDADRLQRLAKKNIVFGVTSAGKAVDLEQLEKSASKKEKIQDRTGARGFDPLVRLFKDQTLVFGSGKNATEALLIADGYPLNLIEEHWPDRFGITASVVALAVLEASALKKAGKKAQPMDEERQKLARKTFEEEGLLTVRALDARSSDPKEQALLEADLAAFAPKA